MDLVTPSSEMLGWQTGSFFVMLAYIAFTIYALIDLIRSEFREQHMKLIWAILILMIPVMGTFLYLGMNQKTNKNRRRFNPNFSNPKN